MSKINPSATTAVRSRKEKLIAAILAPLTLSLALAWITVTGLIVIALPGLHTRRVTAHLAARGLLRLLGLRWRVYGRDRIPKGACVVVSNHASYLDGIILTALLPPHFAFVIKKEMASFPFGGLLLRRLDSLFVEHKRPNSREDSRRLLDHTAAGDALGIFPEGTFTATPGLLPFRSGAFVTATRAAVPLLPLTIHGSRKALPAGSHCPLPGALRLDIHEPIPPNGNQRWQRAALQQQARNAILSTLEEPDLDR